MQSHRGLPKNLPTPKLKPRLFSPSKQPVSQKNSQYKPESRISNTISANESTPSKTMTPENSLDAEYIQRQSSSQSKSKHRIKSKQKPIHINPLYSNEQKKSIVANEQKMVKQIQEKSAGKYTDQHTPRQQQYSKKTKKQEQKKQEKGHKNQFVQTVLQMMGNLAKKNKKSQSLIQPNRVAEEKQNKRRRKHHEQKIQLLQPHVLNLFQQIEHTLKTPECWSTYNGEVTNGKREGYGILYFKNGDKFMGCFASDSAWGHGTYYLYTTRIRVMGIWKQDQLQLHEGYLIQQL